MYVLIQHTSGVPAFWEAKAELLRFLGHHRLHNYTLKFESSLGFIPRHIFRSERDRDKGEQDEGERKGKINSVNKRNESLEKDW